MTVFIQLNADHVDDRIWMETLRETIEETERAIIRIYRARSRRREKRNNIPRFQDSIILKARSLDLNVTTSVLHQAGPTKSACPSVYR